MNNFMDSSHELRLIEDFDSGVLNFCKLELSLFRNFLRNLAMSGVYYSNSDEQ